MEVRQKMPNSRSISPEAWTHAREALIFYFSRRHGVAQAEDLTQDTLTAVWSREDFEFAHDDDFLRVCLGFARHVSQAGYRQTQRHAGQELDANQSSPHHHAAGARATESRILLEEVRAIGSGHLRPQEWQLISHAANLGNGYIPSAAAALQAADANKFRVYLHRARRKLAGMTGW